MQEIVTRQRGCCLVWLLTLAGLLLACGCAPATTWQPLSVAVPSRVELPLQTSRDGLPYIEITNPRAAPGRSLAAIDTGAGGTFVSASYVAENKLEARGDANLELYDAHSSSSRSHYVVRIPSMKFGAAVFNEFDAVVDRTGLVMPPLDAVLGRPVFHDVLLTIDYPAAKVYLETGSLPPPNGQDVLPLRRDNRDNLLVPMSLGGEQIWATLDTGMTGVATSISESHARQFTFVAPPVDFGFARSWFSSTPTKIGRLESDIQIGKYTIRRPLISLKKNADEDYLGAAILKHFAVTIDQKNDRIRLSRSSTAPIETPSVRYIPIEFANDRTVGPVLHVKDGSPAAAAGVKDGDLLLAVEGIPLSDLNEERVVRFEQLDSVMLRLLRDRKAVWVKLPIAVIVQ